jgi:hypothetical protein
VTAICAAAVASTAGEAAGLLTGMWLCLLQGDSIVIAPDLKTKKVCDYGQIINSDQLLLVQDIIITFL